MYNIITISDGVELHARYTTEFVEGILKLVEDGYEVFPNTSMNKLGVLMVFAKKGEIKPVTSKEDNQQIILLNEELKRTKEKLNSKALEMKELKNEIKKLKYGKKEKE